MSTAGVAEYSGRSERQISPASSSNMPEFTEYSYAPTNHLTGDEAVREYLKAKADNPKAIVHLDEMECGHWRVDVYRTNSEIDAYLHRYAQAAYQRWFRQLVCRMRGFSAR